MTHDDILTLQDQALCDYHKGLLSQNQLLNIVYRYDRISFQNDHNHNRPQDPNSTGQGLWPVY